MGVRRVIKCTGCGNRIDPDCCHCGDPIEAGKVHSEHSPVPVGCTCGYVKLVKRIKTSRWSMEVSAHMDPARPKYSAAVLSIAALVGKLDHTPENKVSILRVLVSNLEDACKEAEDNAS